MNAIQIERLLLCARRALALLDPSWQAAWDLKVALAGCQDFVGPSSGQWTLGAPILLNEAAE
jgi:hypothetical protein